jgi:methyltransferase (TIGR00027 family)
MVDSPIAHVADTAFWVATFRADEGERADALFRDPLAAKLVAGRGRAIAERMADGGLVAWSVVMRTLIIDELIATAIAAGVDSVLNLGAGLDTRPYRLPLPADLLWTEVDFADTITFKQERLSGEQPRCRLRQVAIDLGDADKRRALLSEVNASAEKVLVLTEGVIPYLETSAVAKLAQDLCQQSQFAACIVDYSSPHMRTFLRRTRHRQQLKRAPFKFRTNDWHGFFKAAGWQAKDIRYLAETGIRLRRLPPLPWWRFVETLLMSRSRRRQLRQGTGYVLLEKCP